MIFRSFLIIMMVSGIVGAFWFPSYVESVTASIFNSDNITNANDLPFFNTDPVNEQSNNSPLNLLENNSNSLSKSLSPSDTTGSEKCEMPPCPPGQACIQACP